MKQIFIMLACVLTLSACQSNNIEAGEACGRASVFFVPPKTQDLYMTSIDQIDGSNVVTKGAYKLAPGKHSFKVYEKITDSRLSVVGNKRGYSKVLVVEIEANKRYNLAAKFIPEKSYSKKNEYWEPVVWQVTDEPCEG
ncbi:hypothetical protein [Corallincola spongiicola]|uniref:DUF2846 domain-containing protein n=1 Tax=Corallincola spongiicola TaxID=2520508 RepID=A0ABY1WSY3_9GAMM|nr:hypothetical protein [Corallincola spongiicola]TAA47850.1 hypothetical protein EXY25_00960 [Corallincola spongiicola]